MLQYREVGSLGSHVERVFKQVGRERCFVSVYDDMVADPRKRYVELLDFIGVEDDGRTEFKRTRQNMGFKSEWLQQYVINPPKPIAAALLYWHKKGVARPEWLRRARKRIRSYNTAKEERTPLSPELRAELRTAFAPEVRKLEGLLGRDLSSWT